MKRFWIVLGSLALVVAFAMPAAAVDVKFSGEFYVAGDYYSRTNPYDNASDASTAFFRQRLRVQTEFIVSPGLSLVTRFDALEKIWGDNHWGGTRGDTFGRPTYADDYYSRVQENIEFEQAYIKYDAGKVGSFIVGYAPFNAWGTIFGDSVRSAATIQWAKPIGNWAIGAQYVKALEGSTTYKTPWANKNDNDFNIYAVYGKYTNDKIDAGLRVAYARDASEKGSPWPGAATEANGWILTPYVIAQFGPVKLQGELEYWDGRIEYNSRRHTDIRALAAYVDGQVAIGPAYVGGLFAYASGNDAAKYPKKAGTVEGVEHAWGGVDFKPTLILWNEDVCDWAGDVTALGPGMRNAKLFQLYAGAAVKAFDFKLALSYARANEINMPGWTPGYQPKNTSYGWELDGTATYKITNNLSYMVGAGYLWAGDYFKSRNGYTDNKNIYVFTNKLTLTF